VTVSLAFTGSASKTYEFEVQKNSGATAFPSTRAKRSMGTGGASGSVSMSALINLNDGDTAELWVRCTDATPADATLTEVNFSLSQVNAGNVEDVMVKEI
jgi:hypothetical protein